MILFDDWNIRADEHLLARQFDDNSRTLLVTGDLPEGWEWAMLIQVGNYMDLLPLTDMEGGKGIVLRAQQLAMEGYYTLQLRGVRDHAVRHTNTIMTYIPASLSGDAHWPQIPTLFTQLEQRVKGYASHPPFIGTNGTWWLWNGTEYEDGGHNAVEQLLAALPNGDEVSY